MIILLLLRGLSIRARRRRWRQVEETRRAFYPSHGDDEWRAQLHERCGGRECTCCLINDTIEITWCLMFTVRTVCFERVKYAEQPVGARAWNSRHNNSVTAPIATKIDTHHDIFVIRPCHWSNRRIHRSYLHAILVVDTCGVWWSNHQFIFTPRTFFFYHLKFDIMSRQKNKRFIILLWHDVDGKKNNAGHYGKKKKTVYRGR